MKNTILPTLALSALATVGSFLPASAFTSAGVIESVNPQNNIIRLRDGDAYKLPAHVDISNLRPGDQVSVDWETQNPSSIDGRGSDETIWLLKATGIKHAPY
ncbi:DUF1344 domain-containing protein [Martelella sp. FOR1707]